LAVLEKEGRETLARLRERGTAPLPTPAERRTIRERAGVSIAELATVLGVSPVTIWAWESGNRNPSRRTRERYREALAILRGAEK